jgi:fructan beta-fructosidase
MHWGHAISPDLITWEHLPVALEPDSLGYIFSGSAVIDENNTSGLGSAANPAMIAIYTYHDPIGEKNNESDYQTQGIAYSNDKGRTWKKYDKNPVLKNPGIKDFRDPKVGWIENDTGGKWIMSLAVLDKISFYSSPNLLDWTLESSFNPDWAAYGGVWECPDLFKLVDSEGVEKWVLLVSINPGGPNGGSATQYFIGNFDGKTYSSDDNNIRWLDYGTDNYAGVTWSNIPENDDRKLFIGWMSNWNYGQAVPTHPWRSAMTIPRNLELIKSESTYLVASRPIVELQQIVKSNAQISGNEISLEEELMELHLTPLDGDFNLELSNDQNEKLVISKTGSILELDRSGSGSVDFEDRFAAKQSMPLDGVTIEGLRIFVDRSSVEVFVNEGELVMTAIAFPSKPYKKMRLTGFEDLNHVNYLKSIW